MAKITVTLTVDIEPNGESVRRLAADLEGQVRSLAGDGSITGYTMAEVESWDVDVSWED